MKIYAIILLTLFLICESMCVFLLARSILYPMKYEDYINLYSTEFNLSPDLVASIINVESHFQYNVKSEAGAVGLMQLMPTTASYISNLKKIDYENQSDLLNPQKNIEIGCCYFKYLMDIFGDEKTSLCAYNAGETNVKNWLKNSNYSEDGKHIVYTPYN